MKKYILITLVALLARQTITSSIRSSSIEPPLYGDYGDDYYDNPSPVDEKPKVEQKIHSNNKPTSIPESTSATMLSPNDANPVEDDLLLSAGLSQVYSSHNSNPNRDAKAMKLLQERAGDEAEVPMNCSQYKVS